jgi:hypothetical protein
MTQKDMEEVISRLVCQSAALMYVLKTVSAGDGEPILNVQRQQIYQQKLDLELLARGVQ